MELIPILSTIILVATISTFILAVGAYILYKIREGKVQKQPVKRPENLQAEYVVPREKPVKRIFVEEVVDRKSKMGAVDERYQPVQTQEFSGETSSEMFEKEEFNDQQIEMPKQKYVNVQTLDNNENKNDYNSDEIKWR
jgi:hypothetical protein